MSVLNCERFLALVSHLQLVATNLILKNANPFHILICAKSCILIFPKCLILKFAKSHVPQFSHSEILQFLNLQNRILKFLNLRIGNRCLTRFSRRAIKARNSHILKNAKRGVRKFLNLRIANRCLTCFLAVL